MVAAKLVLRAASGLLLALCLLSVAVAADEEPSSGAWQFLREKYYGDHTMGVVDERFMSLEAPGSTPDPAATPLTLRFAPDAHRRIKRVRVFIDNNPSPLAATFDLGESLPIEQIDMRVRIDRFTSVRAVAETAAGDLEMRSTWVKASGGCSTPPGPATGGALGEIRLRPAADGTALQVSIRHPNSSGFQIDPVTGDNIPAHYISHLRVTAGGAALLDAELGISISENPTLRIAAERPLRAPVTVEAVDSETQAHYTASWQGASPAAAQVSGASPDPVGAASR